MSATNIICKKAAVASPEDLTVENQGEDKLSLDSRPVFRRPHICFVAPQTWPVFSGDAHIEFSGGAEVQQSILARALVRTGYRVSMICLDYGQPSRAVLDGVTVHKAYRPFAGLPVLRFLHPRITMMWRSMREVDADIYYQRSSDVLTTLVAEFCRFHGKRSIFAGASDVDFLPGHQPIRFRRDKWLFEHGLRRVDRLIVQNATQERSCRIHYGRDSILIPSCYELPPDSKRSSGEFVLWVGSIRRPKRPELFLELARRLPQERFVLIGGAGDHNSGGKSYFEQIRKDAAALPNVEFTGFLPLARVEKYFDRAKVLVNTSVYEGMPNTFLQAWARGVPTAAFLDTGGRLHGRSPYPIVADMDQATAQVTRLCSEEGYYARIAAQCRQYFEATHSIGEVVSRYGQLLDELAPSVGAVRRVKK